MDLNIKIKTKIVGKNYLEFLRYKSDWEYLSNISLKPESTGTLIDLITKQISSN